MEQIIHHQNGPDDVDAEIVNETIVITITNDAGAVVFSAECKSVDSAIQELGKYGRMNKSPLEHDDF